MPQVLRDSQLAQYHRDGFLHPIDALSEAETASVVARMTTFEQARGRPLEGLELHKSYLIFTWLDEVVRHPRVLDIVEDVIGPDILAFSSSLFIKQPGDGRYVSWHQDSTYWAFEPHDVLTAWIALTPATLENGCMRIMPGTHREQLAHVETNADDNMLTRGQTIAGLSHDDGVPICLRPGQLSLHNERTAHSSGANRSAARRIGFAVRYLPAHVRQVGGPPLTAMLVRGNAGAAKFELERSPAYDAEPVAMAFFEATLERHRASRYSTA